MRRRIQLRAVAATALLSASVFADGVPSSTSRPKAYWPQFRGEQARGVVDDAPLPTKWDVEKNEGIKWKAPIAGLGLSSPIVWGDRVYVTTCVREGGEKELKVGLYGDIAPIDDSAKHSWHLIALNTNDGKVVWDQTAYEGVPKIKRHPKSSHANCTPATDGKHVVAFFGSEGLYCYDTSGRLLWKKDLGVLDAGYFVVPDAQWEFASSPIIYRDMVIVQCDVQKDSFLSAFSIADGKELWRTPRNDVPTWSTPTVYAGKDRAELIVNGYKHMGGYDPMTGKELWRMGGGSDIPVPTPIVAHDLIYLTNSHTGPQAIYAVKLGALGDITLKESEASNTSVAWMKRGQANYMQTPLVYGDLLYACKDNGILSCLDAKTGEKKYRMRVGSGNSGFTASPVAGDNKLYVTSEEGEVSVFPTGPDEPKPLAVNKLNESSMATPAIADGMLFIRGQKHLFCVGK